MTGGDFVMGADESYVPHAIPFSRENTPRVMVLANVRQREGETSQAYFKRFDAKQQE